MLIISKNILGIRFDVWSSIDTLVDHIFETKRFTLVTPNIDHIVRINRDPNLKGLYLNSSICINDSRVFSLIYFIFYFDLLPAIPGSDLTKKIFSNPKIAGKSIAVIGCESWQIDYLNKFVLSNKVSISHYNPPMQFYDDVLEVQKVVDFVKDDHFEFVFLAVGSPQQEILADKIKCLSLDSKVLCIGASIDYLTGKERRAPKWIQIIYLEWLFRFLQLPHKRFHRYFINCPRIFYYLIVERLKRP